MSMDQEKNSSEFRNSALLAIMQNVSMSVGPEDELRRLHAENEILRAGYDAARLEIESLQAQMDAVGAGGVETLIGSTREATSARWYMVNSDGMATLCAGREDAENTAQDAQATWPRMGPHRAVQLAEAAPQPAAQALDAQRYKFLRDGEWRDTDLEPVIRLQLNELWDAKIDAAIAAQQGATP